MPHDIDFEFVTSCSYLIKCHDEPLQFEHTTTDVISTDFAVQKVLILYITNISQILYHNFTHLQRANALFVSLDTLPIDEFPLTQPAIRHMTRKKIKARQSKNTTHAVNTAIKL